MTINDILNSYNPERDPSGYAGRRFEVTLRYVISKFMTGKGVVSKVKPQGVTDIIVKPGVALESKSGAGYLMPAEHYTKEAAFEAFDTYMPMKRATHVAYCPKWTGNNLQDVYILPQRKFIRILADCGLLVARKSSPRNGQLYGVAIQTYTHQPRKEEKLIAMLQAEAETLQSFLIRMKTEKETA